LSIVRIAKKGSQVAEYSFSKATVQHRLGGWAVDLALNFVTFGIGWFIWSLIIWGQGQTPGKQLLKMRVYDKTTAKPAKWGHMAIRQFLLPMSFSIVVLPIVVVLSLIPNMTANVGAIVILYLGVFVGALIDAFWIFKGNEVNRLVDVFSKTDVLNESPDNV
jgi:Na+/phosphate symporter